MSIYRGAGGAGDAVADSSSEALLVQQLAIEAQASADAAATSETNAAGSASAAATSASNALTAENNAETAETNAETAQAAAEAAQLAAEIAQTAAELAETNAETAETNAETAQTAAELAETNAETAAATATTQAGIATTQASNASTSASAALAAQVAAEAAFDAFDDIYLGAKASNPTVDNDGNALTTGDQYFNTVSNELRVWNGSSWQAASVIGGTVTTLEVTGVASFSDGTVSLPSITNIGDTNTGIYFPAADTIAFTEGGVESMRINSSGFLGVGNNNPQYRLDVTGQFRVADSIAAGYVTNILENTNGTGYNQIYFNVGSNGASGRASIAYAPSLFLQIGPTANDTTTPVTFVTNNGTERMRIDSAGNVGIGTSSPSYKLDIAGGNVWRGTSAGSSSALYISGGIPFLGTTTNTAQCFITNDTERMRIDASGNVGIGAASGGARLQITGTTNGTSRIDVVNNTSSVTASFGSVTDGTAVLKTITASPLVFGVTDTERMRIDSSGNCGIGTSSPAAKLDVNGDASISGLTVGKGGGGVGTNAAFGLSALANGSNTGADQVAIGRLALTANSSGSFNVAVGSQAAFTNTTGSGNVAVGYATFYLNTTGGNNTAIGADALRSNTTASNNTAVGYQAGYSNTTGTSNAFVGMAAGYLNTTGTANSAFGQSAFYTNTTGSNNTAVGQNALVLNTTGGNNTAIGTDSLRSNTTSNNNTAVGYQAGYSNTTGTLTALGYLAGNNNTTGTNLIAIGSAGGNKNTTGNDNIFIGANSTAASAGVTGSNNIGIGSLALYSNTSGANNVTIGFQSMLSNTTASNNTAVGYQALYTGSTFAGVGANTALGYQAGYTNNSYAGVFIGHNSGVVSTGLGNTFVGQNSGVTVTTGAQNTLIGRNAGSTMTTGSNNTILGYYSGNQGGLDIRTASNYIVLSDGDGNPRGFFDNNGSFFIGGVSSDPSGTSVNGFTYRTDVNALTANRVGGNLFFLGRSSSTGSIVTFRYNSSDVGTISTNGSATAYNTSSDYRLKENIAPMTGALAKVAQLKPVTYIWKATGETSEGFIAHELQEVVPDCVSGQKDAIDNEGKPVYQGVDTSFLVATLTAAIQELNAKLEAQALEIAQLKGN